MSQASMVLVVEDDLRVSDMIREHLQTTMPQASLMTARSLAEAHVFIYQYEFAAFIIDIALPDGSGLEFTSDLQTVFPDARVIMLTGTAYEDVEAQLRHMSPVTFLQKPFDIMDLERHLRTFIPDAEGAPSFQGSLRQLRLVDLIQIKCLALDSCKLVISGTGGMRGIIVVDDGAIIHAETGVLSGNDAFNEILSWKGGVFQEEEFRGDVAVDIHGRWEMVLMEAVRRSDECHALQAA